MRLLSVCSSWILCLGLSASATAAPRRTVPIEVHGLPAALSTRVSVGEVNVNLFGATRTGGAALEPGAYYASAQLVPGYRLEISPARVVVPAGGPLPKVRVVYIPF